jgi:non-specific serine/threonine protein kinase
MSDPTALLSKPSVQLFVERAQATGPDFELTTQNAEDVASICISLDGLPLAIELAAARIAVLSTRQIRAALQRRLTLLASEDQDLPPRQRTLRTAIDWSYQLLSAQEQRLFQELGIFVAGFTLEAARQVCIMEARSWVQKAGAGAEASADGSAEGGADDLLVAGPGLSEGLHLGLLDGVSSLMDKSLLQRGDYGPVEQRFTMLETIREYALDKLAETGEIREMEHRHSTYFLGLIKEALPHLKGPDEVIWLARLDREHNNIRAALDWALEYDVDPALRAIITMGFYWYLRGQHAEMLKWRDRALAKSGRASAATRARVLTFVGWSAYEEQEFSRAKSLLEEGLALSRRAGDTKGIAQALSYLGIVLSSHDDFDGARAALDEAMVLELEAGNKQGVSWLTNALAEVARLQDDWGSAHTYSMQGLEYAVQAADKYKIALSLLNLGWTTTAEGDTEAAEKYLMDGMALMRELGDKIGVSWCLAALTGVVAQGHPLKTARLSGIVERLLDDTGHQLGPADARQYNRNLDMAREQLERLDWEAARKQGRDAISGLQNLDQIIVYVLEHVVP